MMMLKMFCVFDKKTEIYHPPLFAHNTGHAMRIFGDIIANGGTQVGKFPGDFQLWEIGDFNDANACVIACTPHLICEATELVVDPIPSV